VKLHRRDGEEYEPQRRKGRKGLNFSFLGVLRAFAVNFSRVVKLHR
jgi:hypothetical protein